MNSTAISIADLLVGVEPLSDDVKNALRIDTIEEFLLFTLNDIQHHGAMPYGKVNPGVQAVLDHLESHNLKIRDKATPIQTTIAEIYGSMAEAPIAVLHFAPVSQGFPTRHEPDRIITILQKAHPALTVDKLLEIPTATLLSVVSEKDMRYLLAFSRRLKLWELLFEAA